MEITLGQKYYICVKLLIAAALSPELLEGPKCSQHAFTTLSNPYSDLVPF